MPRGRRLSGQLDEERLAQILIQVKSALASVTHELHVAEREVKGAMPMTAARLRAIRTLLAEVREELHEASSPRAGKR